MVKPGRCGVLAETGMRAERVSPGFGTRADKDAAWRRVIGPLGAADADTDRQRNHTADGDDQQR
jgi:hypothetical protein